MRKKFEAVSISVLERESCSQGEGLKEGMVVNGGGTCLLLPDIMLSFCDVIHDGTDVKVIGKCLFIAASRSNTELPVTAGLDVWMILRCF